VEFSYTDVEWLSHGWELGDVWCLTFVRGIDEAEALRRAGADEESIRPLTYREFTDDGLFPRTVLAGHLEDWVVLIERNSSKTMEPDALSALSTGTEVVSVMRHDYASNLFVYATDGEEVTSFDPSKPAWRYGSNPDLLLEAMRSVGFDPTHLPGDHIPQDESEGIGVDRPIVNGALMLAARITGVMLTQEALNGPLMGGVVDPRARESC
jgi:hypothetical protein